MRGQIVPPPDRDDTVARDQNRAFANRRLGNRQNNAGAEEEGRVDGIES
jgi:hypothetical protein